MSGNWQPDTLSKFIKLQDAVEVFSNNLAEELGEFHRLTTDSEMVFARLVDLVIDIENITCGAGYD
jgi:hypothetical protein